MIHVGDRVRSFDFQRAETRDVNGPEACYVEGVVQGIGCQFTEPGDSETVTFNDCGRYQIRVERFVLAGKETASRPRYVYPPVNGTPTMLGEVTDGVVRCALDK
jgi:hypothetical protein